MKKYYAPVAKTITLDSEALMATSNPSVEEGTTEENCSNRHRRNIWGEEY